MSISRYESDSIIGLGQQRGTASAVANIRYALKTGSIRVINTLISTGNDRLDSLAGAIYGDSRYWWVLAAASGIGWGMQVPAGTVISILSLDDVRRVVD